ncbi:MAG: phosphatidylglycerol lysyltransferase domain-containing protein [Acidobacteria bacterium]|nr:phosphatidylglycerol lysyltransferase domain-containing protein [Acidobacteriota bacterium]
MENDPRLAYLQAHGDFSSAYSTLDPGLRSFLVPGVGYQAYAVQGRRVMGLFNPVCADSDRPQLLRSFIKTLRPEGIFQVDGETAHGYQDLGLRTHRFGMETVIMLDRFQLSGAPMRMVREACNRGRLLGYEIAEIGREIAASPATWARLQDVSHQWLATRIVKTREIGVLIRRSVFAPEDGCRKFVLLDPAGEIEGYQVYDPIFRQGSIAGYSLTFARFAQDRLKGHHYFMTVAVLGRLRKEDCGRIELGLSPLYKVMEEDPLNASGLLPRLMNLVYQHGGRFYGFKGLALHKRKYRGTEYPAYLATPRRIPLSARFGLIRLTGLLGRARSPVEKPLASLTAADFSRRGLQRRRSGP